MSGEVKGITPEIYRAVVQIVDERMKEIKVTREDFDQLRKTIEEARARSDERFGELARAVAELAEAQKRTEQVVAETRQDVGRLDRALAELAEAQKRTEQRVEELAEAQKETRQEVGRLDRAMAELAEAQKRTEQRVEELAEAQKETRQEVGRLDRALAELAEAQKETRQELKELAEAQKRTEQVVAETRQDVGRLDLALAELAVAQKGTRREVGRLSDTVGFTLEDIARVVLPGYLERHFGVRVERLQRRHFTVNGAEYEVDLYGIGQRDGTKVTVLGEVKHRIYAREVRGFVRLLARVMPLVRTEVVKVIFGFLVHPSAEAVAEEAGITLVASYER